MLHTVNALLEVANLLGDSITDRQWDLIQEALDQIEKETGKSATCDFFDVYYQREC
jgi:hypothetical protein